MVLRQLCSVAKRLAAPAPDQARYLAALGTAPSVDELGLELDDLVAIVPRLVDDGVLSELQMKALTSLDRKLAEMSTSAELWTMNALVGHPTWAEVRRLAAVAARELCGEA
jgi:hypothetical protein